GGDRRDGRGPDDRSHPPRPRPPAERRAADHRRRVRGPLRPEPRRPRRRTDGQGAHRGVVEIDAQPRDTHDCRMKRMRWAFAAAALVGIVALVVPAVGQGKAASGSLGWSGAPGGPVLTSDDFGAVDGGARAPRWFILGNSSLPKSGQLTIRLIGSKSFSITRD